MVSCGVDDGGERGGDVYWCGVDISERWGLDSFGGRGESMEEGEGKV